MKRIWMLAAAGLLVVATGCAKQTDTMDMGAGDDTEVTGAIEGSMTQSDDMDEMILTSNVVEAEESMGSSRPSMVDPAQAVADRLRDIHFDFDKALIREDDKGVLLANAELIKANPGLRLNIEGHCDDRGTTAYNLALGERRAAATRRYLIALGVSPAQLDMISHGEERGLCSDPNEACWSRNRRAHMVLR